MKLNLEIDTEDDFYSLLERAMRWYLTDLKELIEFHRRPEDIETWEAICKVLAYISSKADLSLLENHTSKEWINMMAKDT